MIPCKFITNFKELHGNPNVSICEHISKNPIAEKEVVLKYFRSFASVGIRCSTIYDCINKEHTGISIYIYTDGEYTWTSEDIYYFKKYNIPLESKFIEKAKRWLSFCD